MEAGGVNTCHRRAPIMPQMISQGNISHTASGLIPRRLACLAAKNAADNAPIMIRMPYKWMVNGPILKLLGIVLLTFLGISSPAQRLVYEIRSFSAAA